MIALSVSFIQLKEQFHSTSHSRSTSQIDLSSLLELEIWKEASILKKFAS